VVNRTIDALNAGSSRYRQLPVTQPSCGDTTTFVGYLYGVAVPTDCGPGATEWRDKMKTLKRIAIVALLALLTISTGTLAADNEHGYSRIFIFGASFIDPGNRYADTGVYSIPPFLDPLGPVAYDVGGHRPTNGRTWVEIMAQEMGLTPWAKPAFRDPVFGNYAYDHAFVRNIHVWGPSVYEQIALWDANGYCTNEPMNDTLFVLDSGAADLFDIMTAETMEETFSVISDVMLALTHHIEALHECGARNLLIADLVPLGYAPVILLLVDDPTDPVEVAAARFGANQLTKAFNMMLLGTVNGMMVSYPELTITTTEFYGIGQTVMDFPENFGFTNVTDPCVTFFVVEGAYCENPKEYFFWDFLHMSKAANALLGRHALGQLPPLD